MAPRVQGGEGGCHSPLLRPSLRPFTEADATEAGTARLALRRDLSVRVHLRRAPLDITLLSSQICKTTTMGNKTRPVSGQSTVSGDALAEEKETVVDSKPDKSKGERRGGFRAKTLAILSFASIGVAWGVVGIILIGPSLLKSDANSMGLACFDIYVPDVLKAVTGDVLSSLGVTKSFDVSSIPVPRPSAVC